MEVALDGAHGAAQGLCQGLHLGPAQARLVVCVIGEGTVGWDGLGRNSGVGEVLDLHDAGKLGLLWHGRLLLCSAAVRFDDRIHQGSGGHPVKDEPRRFFYALFTGAYFTYTGILALAPEPLPPPCPLREEWLLCVATVGSLRSVAGPVAACRRGGRDGYKRGGLCDTYLFTFPVHGSDGCGVAARAQEHSCDSGA